MIKLDGVEYRTKIQATKAVQATIKDIDFGDVKADHKHYNFLCDLINLHEWKNEKLGSGLQHFIVKRNAYNSQAKTLFVLRTDGTEIDFSYKNCIGTNYRCNLTDALRASIAPYTHKFKTEQPLICAFCSVDNLIISLYHTDHKTVPFATIKDDFLKNNDLVVPTLFKKHLTLLCPIFNESDKYFEQAWIKYHNSCCDFQILCYKCNTLKSNK